MAHPRLDFFNNKPQQKKKEKKEKRKPLNQAGCDELSRFLK
jgi:hypothetical protein